MSPSREELEAGLAASERQFRSTLDALLEGVNLVGFDRRIRYINPAGLAHGRQSRDTAIGRTLRELYPGFAGTPLDQAVERCLDERMPWRETIPFTFPDGDVRWFQVSVEPVPEGLVILSVDVDEAHRAAAKLAAAEERQRGLLAGVPDIIFVVSQEGIFLDCHVPRDELLVMDPSEFLGQPLTSRLPPHIAEASMAAITEALRTGQPQTIEYPLDVRAGRRWFDARVVPVNSHRVSVVVRDISERHELEEQLRQSQKMEAIGQLASGIAHDFNNLLTVIGANTEYLTTQLVHSGVGIEELAELAIATRRGTELVQRLLRFSRRGILEQRMVALGDEIEELLPVLQRLVPESVTISATLHDEGVAIRADVTALHQMLMNLCTNARDAMPTGGRLTIATDVVALEPADARAIGGLAPGRYARVMVGDTGTGMDEVQRSRAFEPFFTTKAPGVGTGLGLAMVYGLMKGHGGTVTLESTTGVGTTATLYFPAVDRPATLGHHEEEPGPTLPRGTETVLVVEDEPAIRRVAATTLRRLGYTVHEASDGAEGESLYREHRTAIDLVVTDLVMPRLGGAAMLERLRRDGMTAPVVVMTGYAPGSSDVRTGLPPDVAFLPKPWTLADLATKVRIALDQ